MRRHSSFFVNDVHALLALIQRNLVRGSAPATPPAADRFMALITEARSPNREGSFPPGAPSAEAEW